jgi:acyl-CoA synthetase (AMP-forming)/AMP-acid ligase II
MTVMAPPGMGFMTDAVAHWAAVRPDAEALTYGEVRWTWAQWHDRIRRVAGGLSALGLGRGDRVAFLDKNNPACLEVALGAGLLGAASAVVNWRLAAGELDYVINDSGASVLFAGAELLPAVEAIRDRLPGVTDVMTVGGPGDGYEAFLATARPAGRGRDVTAEDLWLVMYSSGTTGRPKGVMLSHRNIEHTQNAVPLAPMGPGDRNLVAMPLFHVGGTGYALFGIYAGAPSTFTREPDPASLLAAFAAGATHAFLVPAVVSALLAAGEKAITALSELKYLLYGAAPMPLAMLRQALAAWPGYLFVSDRVKDMIITGGENVYSPEVEQVVAEHPAVAEVAVIGVPDDRWGEAIKAVIALRPGQQATGPEIIGFTRERLAHYKCPSTVNVVDALPRNPSGKILKRTLRAPYWEGRDRQI